MLLFSALLLAYGGLATRNADLVAPFEAAYQDRGVVSSKTVAIADLAAPLHYLDAGGSISKLVLFVHGAAFSARTWQVLGSLDALAGAGYRAIAIDVPGYGAQLSGAQKVHDNTLRRELLARFLDAIGWRRPVLVVSASMGGSFGSPFVLGNPQRAAGYLSVAAMLDETAATGASKSLPPALIVWGSEDAPDSSRAHSHMQLFPQSQKIVFPDAPHPCYLKDPKRFNELLLTFASGRAAAGAEPLTVAARWGGEQFEL